MVRRIVAVAARPLNSVLPGDGVALFAGLLLPLAFAPFRWFPFTLVSVALAFHAVSTVGAARAFWRGWLFGLGAFGFGVSWVYESFRFSYIAPPLAVFLTGLFVVFLALFPALLGLLARKFPSGSRQSTMLLILPAAWILLEWARGTFLTGFTWLQLGYSQVHSPLAGWLPVLGVYGVGLLVAVSAGMLLLIIETRRAAPGYLIALVAIWAGGEGMRHLMWTEPAGEALRVALVQGNVAQDIKWKPEQRAPTLERYLELTRRHWDSDLIVWPETALPGYYREFGTFINGLEREARASDTAVVFGVATLEKSPLRYYNSIVAIDERRSVYSKHHLVPFGEYLPLEALLQPIIGFFEIPMSDFSRGPRSQPPVEAAGQRLGLSICYEAAFGREIMAVLPDATILVNVSNDAWFGDTVAPHQHLEIAQARAIESGRPFLRATNTGISAIIRFDGRLQSQAPQFETVVVAGSIIPRSGLTPYARFGDVPALAAAVLLLLSAGVRGGRSTWK